MIGKVIIGSSFRGCLNYCFEDKKMEMDADKVTIENRSTVLEYNNCFGTKAEIIEQFNDVRKLNPKLAKPVMHITLSFAPGEVMEESKLKEIAHRCAEHFRFDANQFIAFEHKDTDHQHIHIVANRIGFDKKTVSDGNSYKAIAEFCRKMELQYGLQQVLSPKAFLPKEQRSIPRLDKRKLKMKADIEKALMQATDLPSFIKLMQQQGYKIEKGRGISFIDDKGMRVKGSELGYSLQVIERQIAQGRYRDKELFQMAQRDITQTSPAVSAHSLLETFLDQGSLIGDLLKSEEEIDTLPYDLEALKRKKKKRKGPRL